MVEMDICFHFENVSLVKIAASVAVVLGFQYLMADEMVDLLGVELACH